MDKGGTIQVLDRGRILAELGPMRLVIQGCIGQVPQMADCIRAAKESFSYLTRIALHRKALRLPCYMLEGHPGDPLVRCMIDAVGMVDPHELTPMAAVAGTISEYVAHFLVSRGMTRVVVNNGGDIAIFLAPGNRVRMAVVNGDNGSSSCLFLNLESSQPSWGIATSGLGGRSLTRGVATAVTVLAQGAAIADAAATAVANASFVEDQGVEQAAAASLDPDTDIPDKLVTVRAQLAFKKKEEALEKALAKASSLLEDEVILGAYVNVQGIDDSVGLWEELIEK